MDHESILSRIEDARPDILLVAMGHPKQEQWLAMHRHRLKVPLCMGVGASLDFIAGSVSRAPVWMQSSGLEWLYRAAQEPRRLVQRYLSDACGLARHLPAQVAANAMQPRGTADSLVETHRQGNASVISVRGDLTGTLLRDLEGQLGLAYVDDCHIVLDLAQTGYVGLDAVGFLVHLAKMVHSAKRQLWLARIPSHVLRVFRAARMDHYFGTTSSVSDAIYRIHKSESRLPSEAITVHKFIPPGRDIRVQVEWLKDFLRRIVSLSQSTKLSAERPRTSTPAAR
jgi:N-acetylglucosaminyldiphosphoundecaprenol N-acetyl-beta-D-mannosaminyltransferase